MNHYTFEDIKVGMKESFTVQITDEMMEQFYQMTKDENPLHRDPEFAKNHGYEQRVVYGMLTSSFLSTMAGVYLPGERSVIHRIESEFPKPVYVGDTLTITGTVQETNEAFQIFTIKVEMRNQDGKKVCRAKMRLGFLKETKGE